MPGLIQLLLLLMIIFLMFGRADRISDLLGGNSEGGSQRRVTLSERMGLIALVLASAVLSFALMN